MSRLKPYRNWTKNELKDVLLKHVNRMELSSLLRILWIDLILEAFESNYWNVIQDYNGCTIVQDWLHPDPACFCHDYMWISGHGGKLSDEIFKALMIAEGMPKGKLTRRKFAVRMGWIFGFKWKYKAKRTQKEPTKAMINLHNYIQNK